MSDKSKKETGFPRADNEEELSAEFDAWDKNFDSLFNSDEPTAESRLQPKSSSSPAQAPARDAAKPSGPAENAVPAAPESADNEFAKELDFLSQPHAVGELLGSLPPPLEEVGSSEPMTPFGDGEDDEDSGVFTSAPRLEAAPAAEAVSEAVADGAPAMDVAGLARTGVDEAVVPPQERQTRPRMPAIVRRDDLERRRRAESDSDSDSGADDFSGDIFGAEATRIADSRQLESLVESAGELWAEDPEPPAITVAVDEDFYDDIVIGEESEPEAPKAASPPVKPMATGRRISRHVVRRDALKGAGAPEDSADSEPPAAKPMGLPALLAREGEVPGDVAAGRAVDPEITLDMRVSDADLLFDLTGDGALQGTKAESARAAQATGEFDDDAETGVRELGGQAGDEPVTGVHVVGGQAGDEPVTGVHVVGGRAASEAFELGEAGDPELGAAGEPELDAAVGEFEAFELGAAGEPELAGQADEIEAFELGAAGDRVLAAEEPAQRTEEPGGVLEMVAEEPSAGLEVVAEEPGAGLEMVAEEPGAGLEVVAEEPGTELEVVAEEPGAELEVVAEEPGAGIEVVAEEPVWSGDAGEQVMAAEAEAQSGEDVGFEVVAAVVTRQHVPETVVPAAAGLRVDAALPAVVLDAEPGSGIVELPPAKLSKTLPRLPFDLMALPEQADVVEPGEVGERMARDLAMYEREIEVVDVLSHNIRMRLEAGRLAEKLGAPDQAREHYEYAVQDDPELVPALRALRRIEQSSGQWQDAINYLDAEIMQAGEAERPVLRAHRVDMLMAAGEQDLARVAVGEILDEDPRDVRALFANLELAFVDGRHDEFAETLERLALVVEDEALAGSLHMLRGRTGAAAGDAAAAMEAYTAAATSGSPAAVWAMGRAARRAGDTGRAVAVMGQLEGGALEQEDAAFAAALQWRRALWAGELGDRDSRAAALTRAAALVRHEPVILAELAEAALDRGDDEAAAEVLLELAVQSAAPPAEQASAYVRAAERLTVLGRGVDAADALRRAAALDPTHPRAQDALQTVLEDSGDLDALIELDRRAAAVDPPGAVFERVRAARRLAEAGLHDEAIRELQAGREVAPGSPAIADELIDVLAVAGRDEERVALFQERLESGDEPGDPELFLLRAARATEAQAEAMDRAWRAALARGTDAESEAAGEADATSDAEAEELVTLMEARDRALAAALDLWQRALEIDPEWSEAHNACIRLATLLGDADIIEDALARAQAAAQDPWYAVTLGLRRAALVLRQSEPDVVRAEDLVREAAALLPEDPRPALMLLILASRDKRYLDAAMVLEERAAACAQAHEAAPAGDAQDVSGEAAGLRFRAAFLLMDPADEPAQAVELLRAVTADVPGFAAAGELLRAAQRRMGEIPVDEPPEEPAGSPEAADPAQPVRADALVRDAEAVFTQAGEPARAVELYQRALALVEPDDVLALFIRDGLRRAAEAAGDAALVAELAAADLARAESLEGDGGAARAAAYERLAWIEETLRGDSDAALRHLRGAAAADPGRVSVLHALAHAHVRAGRWDDLAEVRAVQAERAASPAERAALLLDRLRAAELGGADRAGLLADTAAVGELDPRCRVALLRLEAYRREQGVSPELAELEGRIADYFAADARARAMFLTRAGDTLAELGEPDAAIARYQEASELAGGYEPALFGWQHAAMRAERWSDVAEAALRRAELAGEDADRAARFLFAGVVLMDRADDRERAAEAFARVLDIEPAHGDAFARLQVLLAETPGDLAALYLRRLEVEDEPFAKARLHRALADLYRALGDAAEARVHLGAVLGLVPGEVGAVAELAELAWEQGAWDEAAESLVTRSRLESDPAALRDIFVRLGVIYAEKQPDPSRAIQAFKKVLSLERDDRDALEHLSRLGIEVKDWGLALSACERLLATDEDDDARVAHWHRVGRIHAEGFGDRVRAERAYRTALDLVPTSDAALSALVEFFGQSGDLRSVRVHLDRVIGTMRARLATDVTDSVAYRVMARALAAREQAGVAGSLAVACCAAELAELFGGAAARDQEFWREPAAPSGISVLARRDVDDLLFPRAVSNELRQIIHLLGDRLAKHVGMDVRRYGVGRGDRVEGDVPVMAVARSMAEAMEIETPVVYIAAKEPQLMAVEPTSPVSIIAGAQVAESEPAVLRFVVGRALKLALSWFAVPARMTEDELGVLLVALLQELLRDSRSGEPSATPEPPPGMDSAAVAAQHKPLRRLIPKGMPDELRPFAVVVAGERFDHGPICTGIAQAGCRAGLLACGSIRAALAQACVLRGHADVTAGLADAVIADLVSFAVSEDHVALCAMLAG